MREIDLETELVRCLRCGYCRALCPVFEGLMNESWNARGRILLIRAFKEGSLKPEWLKSYVERIFACTLCKACEEICPAGVPVTELILWGRKLVIRQGLEIYPEYEELAKAILEKGNIFGKEEDAFPVRERRAKTLLYLGCTVRYQYEEFGRIAMALLDALHVEYDLKREKCCAGFLEMLGMEEEFERASGECSKIVEGYDEVIVVCPMCYHAFKDLYGMENVVHLVEKVKEGIEKGVIKLEREVNATVFLHDSCHMGRYAKMFDLPREILSSIPGLRLIEGTRTRERARCCGGPIRVPFTEIRDKVAEAVVEESEKLGADGIVTECPTCFHNIRAVSFGTVYDLLELVAYSARLIDRIPVYE